MSFLDLPAAETPVRFTDVTDPATYYYTPVYWAVAAGITNGTSATTFSPDQDVRRDEFVTFLWRLSGSREPQGTASFTDLAGESDAFRKAISWAEENGIVAGVGGDRFDPSGTVTREQAAAILYRYYNGTAPAASAGFTDVADSWYTDAVNWGYAQGILAGYGTRFGVGDSTTRAQAVTFLYRAENRS